MSSRSEVREKLDEELDNQSRKLGRVDEWDASDELESETMKTMLSLGTAVE